MRWFWLLCLTMAAVWDIKERTVSCILLIICGGFGIVYAWGTEISVHFQGVMIGIGMLILSRVTCGAIGTGDGWFFVASAWYLNAEEMWQLLLGSLTISWLWGIGVILKRSWQGKNIRKDTLPFLACTWPVGIWILLVREGVV